MASLPLPGANEAELMTKVGAGVLHELQKANKLPAWPDTREALLELHAILHEWCETAEETSRYAQRVARVRNEPSASQETIGGSSQQMAYPSQMASNIISGYVEGIVIDSKRILDGPPVSPLMKLRRARKRRAARRGLKTILSVYYPELLNQFEQAATSRAEWVKKHRKDFDRWFDQSRTDAEVFQLLAEMEATKIELFKVTERLRGFIAANYPLPGANSNP